MRPWGGSFDIDRKYKLIEEKEIITQQPEFWNDPKKAEEVMKEIKSIRYWTETYDKTSTSFDDLSIIFEFFNEGEGSEAELDKQYEKTLKAMVQ